MTRGNGITLKDVYEIAERLETKMDKRLTEDEKDIEELKAFQNKIYGIAVLFATIPSLVINFIWNELFKK